MKNLKHFSAPCVVANPENLRANPNPPSPQPAIKTTSEIKEQVVAIHTVSSFNPGALTGWEARFISSLLCFNSEAKFSASQEAALDCIDRRIQKLNLFYQTHD